MTRGLRFYSNKVCKASYRVWGYKVVVKSIEKTMRFRKVVIATEKTIGLTVKKTCLARHYYNLDNRQKTLSCIK